MEKEEQGCSLNEIKVVDDITYRLWKRCVTSEEQRDPGTMRALIEAIESDSYPTSPTNPILKRMVDDGLGFDGYSAAIMTLSYVRELCRYYESLTN